MSDYLLKGAITNAINFPSISAEEAPRITPYVKLAEQLGLRVYQAHSLRTAELRQPIVDARPDLIVVAAFGVILGRSMLELPPLGCVNLHASLLPDFRGAAPISAAILRGDAETGVSLMRMESGLDTGPVYQMSRLDITETDTTESLTPKLAVCAADLLEQSVAQLFDQSLQPVPQDSGATLTRPLVKADGWLDWTRPAAQLERHVRAMWAWPRAWTTLPDGTSLQIHQASVVEPAADHDVPIGSVVLLPEGPGVRCGSGVLLIRSAQLPGGRPMRGQQLANHRSLPAGIRLGAGDPPPTPGPLIRPVE
jgi:methionyl-tRNA formyltransferase